ncbi:MAG: prepilin-type N-terminal cleavage/methylation domain-containing protein [Labilithrix sp.]|nr:prepilin-type N-terminal cleavage/methylation domain-containing protein [Labilithrix sp.]MCW5814024.1 prepilin-type N-terminal cleavage/methylation domain-containing protein [Labilithrix sp.]
MVRIRKRLKQGFTLVELMIVVAIVGVLAVLAVYGVRKYIANAKTAEAKNSLGQIGKDAVTAFEGERMEATVITPGTSTAVIRKTCGTASKAVPASGSMALLQGKKYQSAKLDWSPENDVKLNRGFPCLKFEMTAPQYYSYMYNGGDVAGTDEEGKAISATAIGDLSGDGALFSTFTMNGKIQEGRLTIAPSIDEVSPEE